MKKHLFSINLVLTATFGFTAQAALVTTVKDFTQGDIFGASGLSSQVIVELITQPGSPATVDAPVVGSNTSGTFVHDYFFDPITSLVIAISSGSTNQGGGGIVGLVMEVEELGGGPINSVAVPIGESRSLPLTMTAGKSYRITMSNTGFVNFSGQYLLSVSNVPVPAALWLFGSALLGLFGFKASKSRGLAASA